MASDNTFDWDSYLGKRPVQGGGIRELAAIGAQRAQERINKISQDIVVAKEVSLEARKQQEIDSQTWVGQLGLTPGSIEANAVNLAASFGSGAARVGGQLASLPANWGAAADGSNIQDEDYAAYARLQQGKATADDTARLGRSPHYSKFDAQGNLVQAFNDPEGDSILKRIERSNLRRELGQDITKSFDATGIVQKDSRNALSQDLREGFSQPWQQVQEGWYGAGDAGVTDVVAGLGKLALNAGAAAINNPQASAEYIVENVPQLGLGALGKAGQVGLALSNVGYAADNYSQGIENFRQANDGAMPSADKRQEMGLYAASLALAEQVGDVSLLKGFGKVGDDAVRKSFKQALLDGAGVVAKGTGSEALTEGYQTFGEGKATLKDATAADIYEGAAIGGIAGGGMSSVAGVSKVAEGTPMPTLEVPQATPAEFEKAVADKNPDVFLDPKSPSYDPKQALGVLQKIVDDETATPEDKAKYRDKAKNVVDAYELQIAALRNKTDAGRQKNLAELADIRSQIAEAQAAGSTEMVGLLTGLADKLQKAVDESQVTPEEKAAREQSIKVAEADLVQAQAIYDSMVLDAADKIGKDLDVPATVAAADSTGDQAADAVKKIMVLSMASAGTVSATDARKLANNLQNTLSQGQRDYLKQYANAMEGIDLFGALEQVNQEIIYGDSTKNQKGLVQYQQRAGKFLASGDMTRAVRELIGLNKFRQSHRAKAEALAQAWKEFERTKQAMQLVKDASGKWVASPLMLSTKAVREQGGYVLNRESGKGSFVNVVNREANLLDKTYKALSTAFELTAQGNQQDQQQDPQAQPNEQADPAQQPADVGATTTQETVNPATQEAAPQAVEPAVAQSAPDAGTAPDAQPVELTFEQAQPEGETEADAENSTGKLDSILTGPLAGKLKQSAGGNGSASIRPLVSVKDFLSSWLKGKVVPNDFLKEKSESNEALKYFARKAKAWVKEVPATLAVREKYDSVEENPAFGLMVKGEDGKWDFPENVKVAMLMGGMTWLADRVGLGWTNTEEDIRAILDLKEDAAVSRKAKDAFTYVGSRRAIVANAIGQKAVSALGIKATDEASQDFLPKLEAALGAYTLQMMVNDGLVKETAMSGAEFKTHTKSNKTDVNATQYFIAPAHNVDKDSKTALSTQVTELTEALKGSKNVLEKLFSVEAGMKAPTFEAVPFTQNKAKDSKKRVPSWLADILDKKNKEENFLDQTMFRLVSGLSESVILTLAGYKSVDENSMHVTNRKSTEAKNEGLKREWTNLVNFVSNELVPSGLGTPFFFQHTVWKNQRVGIANNMVNPQTSKIHRFMVYRKSWETEVDTQNIEQMNSFKLRVLEGLGVKTDKKANKLALQEWEVKTGTPEIKAAVAAIKESLAGNALSEQQQADLVAGVAQGGEKFHSLNALVAMAHMENAEQGGKFKAILTGEIDGVTNGPMLTHILMGAGRSVSALFERINKGGFFQNSDFKNYNIFRGSPGVMDLYETTAEKIVSGLNQAGISKEALETIWTFTGKLVDESGKVVKEGRNIVKTPITALGFGSSIDTITDGLGDAFVEMIYSKIEDAAKGKADIKQLMIELNKMLPEKSRLNVNISAKAMLGHTFKPYEEKAIKDFFYSNFGQVAEYVMETEFADLLSRRDHINKLSRFTHGLYDSAYQAVRAQFIKDLVAKGELKTNKHGEPVQDLSAKQERELMAKLRKAEPVMATLMSLRSNDLGAGLSVAKTERELSTDSNYKANVRVVDKNKKGGKSSNKETSVSAQQLVSKDPGVTMSSVGTHSLDSGISHESVFQTEALNIHDANVIGLNDFQATAQNLNTATWNALLEYSPALEAYKALARSVTALSDLVQDPEIGAEIASGMKSFLMAQMAKEKVSMAPEEFLLNVLSNAKYQAFTADQIRLGALAQMQHIDQYASEGGQFDVKDEHRKAAQAKLDEMEKAGSAISPAVEKAVRAMTEALTQAKYVRKGTQEKEAKATKPTTSVFGKLGNAATASAPALVAFFKQNPTADAKTDVLPFLVRQFAAMPDNATAQYYRRIAQMAYKSLGEGVKVQFVTPYTKAEPSQEMPTVASRGWFDRSTNTIYVLSPEFAASGLTSEMLLHEITHAALADLVDSPNKAPEQAKLVAELEAMMVEAKKTMDANGMSGEAFYAAGENIHEFIAWGMTNQKFQREVLAKTMVTDTRGQLKAAMQEFVNKLVSLLFGKRLDQKSDEVDAFTAMVANVTALYNEAAQAQPKQDNQTNAILSMASQVENFTSEQMFEALDGNGVSSQFTEKLRDVMSEVVTKLHGPFGSVKTRMEQTLGKNAKDIWVSLQVAGQRPFAAKVLGASIGFSQKEAYVAEQVEAVMQTVLAERSSVNDRAFRELEKVYLQARTVLKGKISDDLFKFVFMPEKGKNGKSDYLGRFATLALTNEEFSKAMEFATRDVSTDFKGKSMVQRIEMVWRDLMDWIGARWTGTYMGQEASQKVNKLVGQLVEIDARNKGAFQGSKSVMDSLNPLVDIGNEVFVNTKKWMGELADSRLANASKYSLIRGANALVSLTANERVALAVEAVVKMRDQANKASNGTIMGTLEYVRGVPQWIMELLLKAKHLEKIRLATVTDTASAVLAAFKDGGQYLDKESKAAITNVLLRTGSHVLLDKFGTVGIRSLLENPAVLKDAIADEVGALSNYPEVHFYVNQAKGLGFYAATGKVGMVHQLLNAGNISRLYLTGRTAPAHAAEAAPVIERLVALYALQYADYKARKAAIEVLRTESQRGEENGVEMVLKMHKHLDNEARTKNFHESEALMIHGYLPEVLNPKTTFKVARDPDEAERLEELGYVRAFDIGQDTVDPDKRPATLYVLRGGGLNRRLSGVMSITGMNAKGSDKHNQYYNSMDPSGLANIKSMNTIMSANGPAVDDLFNNSVGFDPKAHRAKQNFLLPLINSKGNLVDYRYVMNSENRDTLLDRDNRFEHLLGVLAGSTFDKATSRDQNSEVVYALYKHYNDTKVSNPQGFVQVHHTSDDPRMREIWDMLPDGTKQDIKALWGNAGMMVPKNMVDVLFGYRKASLADAFNKTEPNAVEKMLVATVTEALRMYAKGHLRLGDEQAKKYAKRGAVVVRRIEDAWQEMVQEVKDFIVVKTGTVLLGNQLSNMGMLAMKGVPLVQSLKDQHEALVGIMNYERDRLALARLQALVDTGYATKSMDEVKAEMVRLEDSMARNPVKELVDAGLMPTIVEDVSMEDNPYSYKSNLTQWADEKMSGVNEGVLKVGRFVYMAHDTLAYKLLSKSTQYSDFLARYSLYKYLTTRKTNPVSKANAIFEAVETFVNYDIPLPKTIQYMDDMGVMPFIKYFLSIQRVLAKTFKDAPLQALSVIAMNHFTAGLPMPTDSSFLHRLGGNPFSMGALGLPDAMSESLLVQSSLSLIK